MARALSSLILMQPEHVAVVIPFRSTLVGTLFLMVVSACSGASVAGDSLSMDSSNQTVPEISAEELAGVLSKSKESAAPSVLQGFLQGKKIFLLDVRENEEFARTHIKGSYLVPVMEIEDRLDEIKTRIAGSDVTVVICRSGQRSEMVTSYLHDLGVRNLYNLRGGINAYSKFDPEVFAY